MCTLHAVLDSGAGSNLVRSDMLPLGFRHALNTQKPLPKRGCANGRTLKLLGIVCLHFRLGRTYFHVNSFVTTNLAALLVIGISFMEQHVKGIRFIDGVV